MKMSPRKIALLLLGGLAITDLLIWLVHISGVWPLSVPIFVGLSLLPGAALLRALRVTTHTLLEGLLYSLGLSVLILMLSSLAANQLLWGTFVARPLDLLGILGALHIVVLPCIAAGLWNHQTIRWEVAWPRPSKTTVVLVLSALLLPLLAAGGAFRLNNGGDALVAGLTLCWAAGLIAYAAVVRSQVSDTTLAWCVFMIGLSILLMTSLRSWDISGHDLAREFHVYTITHLAGHWNIASYRDPYNACLSITILPEVYAKLLNVSGLIVFKVVLQVLFAACPVVMYAMLRRYVSKLGALVGCALFISYPTFINDSAMLTRQGVAYLFFSLALLAALHAHNEKVHKSLFLLCALGVVVSHYSTSYMFIAIFGAALACKLLIQQWRGWHLHLRGDKFTILTPSILVLLILGTFLWYAQFTNTAGGLATILTRSLANIPHLLSADNKSSDTSAALVLASRKSQLDLYQSYLARPQLNDKIVNSPQYRPDITADDIPVTTLGKQINSLGVPPSITTDLRQNFAKVLQLLAAVSVVVAAYFGVFYATYLFARNRPAALPFDLICLTLAGIILLVAMVALPNLSLSYGVLRTFQQSLIFLVIPLTVFLTLVGRLLQPWLRLTVATLGMVSLFFLFTGLSAQLLGGVGAPLTMNNHGLYYGLYYTTRADLQGYAWMKAQIPKTKDVRSASFAKALMHDPQYPFKRVGILPTQRHPGSYVYLDQAQIVAHKLYIYQEGSPLITTFPLNYYQDHANHIYSTTTTGVFATEKESVLQ